MPDPLFLTDGDGFAPTAHARGPWDPMALHGGAPSALLADAFERHEPGSGLAVARLNFELLRPVPMAHRAAMGTWRSCPPFMIKQLWLDKSLSISIPVWFSKLVATLPMPVPISKHRR